LVFHCLNLRTANFGILTLLLFTDEPIKGVYDYVICSEVLEHVWEPEAVLKHIVEHIVPGGYLYLSTFFNDMNGHDPFHLVRNTERYEKMNTEEYISWVEKVGMKLEERDKNGVPKIFKKRE